jgi:hypothetical protein
MLTQVETVGNWKIYKDTVTEQHIRERAYFKWLEAGCPDGRSDEFWLSAEGELLQTPKTWRGPSYILGEGVIHCPYIPLTQTPVVYDPDVKEMDLSEFSNSDVVTIEMTTRYEHKQELDQPTTEKVRGILTRFGKKLLEKLKGKSAE